MNVRIHDQNKAPGCQDRKRLGTCKGSNHPAQSIPSWPTQRCLATLFRGLCTTGFFLFICSFAWGSTGTASYYSVESCKREGTWQKYGGRTASGEVFNDQALTCATWGVKFGTVLMVTNLSNGKTVRATVTDRGPSKALYKKGRIVDLSKGAFSKIADLKQGVIPVRVVEVLA